MNIAPDFSKAYQEMMASFSMDQNSLQNAFKTQAAFGEKLSKVALEAVEKTTEISAKWTKDTLACVADMTKVKPEVTDYTKSFNDFTSSISELTTENMAAFAEVAKKVQMETVELMLAAGKTASDDASAAMKKATNEVATAAKKVTVPTAAAAK